MKSEEILLTCIDALERCALPYMLVGSLSVNLYAPPRSTQDVDFVVEMNSGALRRLLAELGPRFRLDPQSRFETVTGTPRHIIDVDEDFFHVELFQLSDDAFDRERFRRRVRVHLLGRDAFAPTAEDVVVMKLRWSRQGHRSKDLEDARNIILTQADNLDWDYIHRWAAEHGTRELLDEIRASLPDFDESI